MTAAALPAPGDLWCVPQSSGLPSAVFIVELVFGPTGFAECQRLGFTLFANIPLDKFQGMVPLLRHGAVTVYRRGRQMEVGDNA